MEKHAGFQWSNMLSEKTCGKGETRTESTSLMKIRKKNERTVSERKADCADLTLLTRGQPDLYNTVLKVVSMWRCFTTDALKVQGRMAVNFGHS